MFSEIYSFLKEKGYDVYSIGQHEGKCCSPYIVIKERGIGEIARKNLSQELIELLIYYPIGKYSKVPMFVEGLKIEMSEFKKARRIQEPAPTIVEDNKKAYFTYLTYQKLKPRERD